MPATRAGLISENPNEFPVFDGARLHLMEIGPGERSWSRESALLFNTANSTLVEMTPSEFAVYRSWRSGNRPSDGDLQFLSALGSTHVLDEGLVTAAGRSLLSEARPVGASIRLVLIPTLKCNFSCGYCYHGGSVNSRMTTDDPSSVLESVVAFLAQYERPRRVTVIWHGGEPLTALDRIAVLSKGLHEYCSGRGVEYEESLLTNGVLLSPDRIQTILSDTAINELQVSIDESRRKGLLPRVVEGVRQLTDTDGSPSVFLKYNVVESAFDFLADLLPELMPLAGRRGVFLRFGFLESHGSIATDKSMSYVDFVENYWSAAARIRAAGLGWLPELPRKVTSVCVADDPDAITIGPDLGLYRCNVHAHDANWRTGTIRELPVLDSAGVHNRAASSAFFDYDASADEECRTCPVMPICLGGCHVKRIHGHRDNDFCDGTRSRIAYQVADFARHSALHN